MALGQYDDEEFAEEVAAYFVKRAKRDPKLQELIERANLFDDIKAHPGWRKLHDMARGQKDRFFDGVVARMWAKPPELPAIEEVAYYQGFYQGAMWVLAHPEMAEHSLYQAARAAYLLSQGRDPEEDDEEEDNA